MGNVEKQVETNQKTGEKALTTAENAQSGMKPRVLIIINMYDIQYSPLNSNSRRPTKLVLIIRCSNYEFALNINSKYNGFSRDHNHLAELTGFLN